MRDKQTSIDLDRCISKISRNDQFALEELYREYKNPIYRFSLMTLGDSGLAEDAMQSTFLKIMSSAGTYKLGTNANAWIFSIARNTCIDIIKKKLPVSADETEMERLNDSFTMDDAVESIAVKEAVAKLSETEREIISLYLFGGLKQTDIARIMGMPYIKVRSLYGYALKKLRKELGGNE